MTDDQKKERLRIVLDVVLPPVHCNGCDEYLCEHTPGEYERTREGILVAVWSEIKNWGQPQ